MTTIRTVTLNQHNDGVHVCRCSTAIGGYSTESVQHNDGASFPNISLGIAHFTSYRYSVTDNHDGMVTLQRTTDCAQSGQREQARTTIRDVAGQSGNRPRGGLS